MARTKGADMLLKTNPMAGDDAIVFDEAAHKYYVHGEVLPTSVTSMIKAHVPEFDGPKIIAQNYDKWSRDPFSEYFQFFVRHRTREEVTNAILNKWASAGHDGTAMHTWIELYLNGVAPEPTTPETIQFQRWFETDLFAKKIQMKRTELCVWWEDVCGGQIDGLAEIDGELCTLDWKRVAPKHSIQPDARVFQYCTGPIKELPYIKFVEYSLQQSMYQVMLHQSRGVECKKGFIVRMFGDRYPEVVQTADYRAYAMQILLLGKKIPRNRLDTLHEETDEDDVEEPGSVALVSPVHDAEEENNDGLANNHGGDEILESGAIESKEAGDDEE